MKSDEIKTILLVEDEEITAMLEIKQLEKKGYSVHHVTTGEEAVKSIFDNALPVDLILMDIDLGCGIDGTQATEQILNHKDIPVVFLSSHTEPAIVEKTEKITSYGYVVKNSGIVVLDASIKMALKLFNAKIDIAKKENSLMDNNKIYNESLKQSSENWQETFNAITDFVVLVNNDHEIIEINKAALYALGLKKADVVGKKCYKVVHKSEEPIIECPCVKSLKSKSSTVSRYIENNRVYELSAWPIFDKNNDVKAFTHIVKEITEQEQMGNILEEKQKLNEMLLDSLPHPAMLIHAKDKVILAANKVILQSGAKIGGHCWREVGKEDYISKEFKEIAKIHSGNVSEAHGIHCTFCQGDQCFISSPEQNNPAVHSFGKIWDTYWIKVNDEIYLHYFIDITERKRAEEEIQKQLSEKETLLREVHHRVKNNIGNIEGLLMLQIDSNTNAVVKSALLTAISQISSMRVLYDKLLCSEDYKEVSIKNYIESLIDSIIVLFPDSEKITIEKQITDFKLNTNKIITIGIALNEIITNAFKYAFKERDSGHISVILSKTENHATLIVQDNGVGLNINFDLNKSSGFGINILKMFSKSCTIENNKGTRVILNFDI